MKKKIKVAVFTFLLVIFSLLVIMPTSVDAVMLPGWSCEGKYGPTCKCPIPIFWDCYCIIME